MRDPAPYPSDRPITLVEPATTVYGKENDMSAPMYVDKAKVIADLRYRQLHARAD